MRCLQLLSLRVALFSCVLILLLAGLEVCLRTTHAFGARISWSEPDERLGFRYTPGSRYWYRRENAHPTTGIINSFGWRDTEWSLDKPQQAYRVAALGDSYVEAFQVEDSQTFLELAETKLDSITDTEFEFMNFGRSGFTQTEEMIVLEQTVLRFSPDLVMLFFLPANDIGDILPQTALGSLRPFFVLSDAGELSLDTRFSLTRSFWLRRNFNWIKQHSALASLLAEKYMENRLRSSLNRTARSSLGSSSGSTIPGYLSLCTNRPSESYERGYRLAKSLIARMASICKRNGIRFMIVCIDDVYIPEVEEHYRTIDSTFDADYFEDDLRAFAQAIDTDFLGLQTVFTRQYELAGRPLHFGEWDPATQRVQTGHWNYDGHRVVAEAIVEKLLQYSITAKAQPTRSHQ